MNEKIVFTVIGIPTGQKRPRFFRLKTGAVTTHSPKDEWFGLVHAQAVKSRLASPLDGPLAMEIDFAMPKPKSAKKAEIYAWKKPDLDNLAKAVMDACNNAQIWTDDARIVDLHITKKYGSTSCALVRIWPISDQKAGG